MISMHEIGSSCGAANYFDKSFNQDGLGQADGYYVGEKSAAVWQGRGAKILGVDDQIVKREDFLAVLDGTVKNPADGKIQYLSSNSKGGKRRAGYDFTVAPPKSVSIIGLVGNDDRVIDAHVAANKRAMDYPFAGYLLMKKWWFSQYRLNLCVHPALLLHANFPLRSRSHFWIVPALKTSQVFWRLYD